MKNPFIQLENTDDELILVNIYRIASVEKEKSSSSGKYCTYMVLDGGGGAHVATHHIKLQYEEVMEIINNWYRG